MSKGEEILNSEEVDFLLGVSGGTPQKETVSVQSAQQAVTMRGDLDQMPLTDVFQTLGMNKMEGVLRLCNPVEQRILFFQNGYLRLVVPSRILLRRLGQRLVQAEVIDPEQLRSALLEQRKSHQSLDELLVSGGFVSQEQIDQILALQINEELFGLFTWTHGTFEFFKGPPQDPALQQRLEKCQQFDVNSLLLEVARRSDEWEGIFASLSTLDEVPVRTDAPMPEALGPSQQAVLDAVDGRHTYREIAEQTVLSLFDGARAARDLVRVGLIATATDEQMLDLARHHLEQGHGKLALVVAHSLCDRRTERPIELVRALAAVLRGAEEPRLASAVLLEAAQLQADGQQALQLAQEARALNPRDLGTLSFLRTTMMAHLRKDAPEIRQITLDLLDGLIADNDLERLFMVVEETRQIGHYTPAVMVRESRGYAKKRDRESAIRLMLQAAEGYAALDDKRQQLELLELAARLDRNRKDIQKLIQQLRSTPKKRAIRLASSIAAAALVLASAVVWFTSHLQSNQIAKAEASIQSLLDEGKLDEATKEFEVIDQAIGENPDLDGLRHIVLAAQAEAAQRSHKAAQREVAAQMQQAGLLVAEGDLTRAFLIYSALRADPDLRSDVDSAASTRVDSLERGFADAAVKLPDLLPTPPSDLMDRQRIEDALKILRSAAPPALRTAALAVVTLSERGTLPEQIPEGKRKSLLDAATRAKVLLDRAADLVIAYESASQRSSEQRRLDPLFKQALDAERNLDFVLALTNYQKLSESKANTEELARHFRQKVQQLESILSECTAIRAATAAGDFKTANRAYLALQRKFPEVPFQKLLSLPVTVRTSIPGAGLRWNGKDLGLTPRLATYPPNSTNDLEIQLPRFEPVRMPLPQHEGTVDVLLRLESDASTELRAAIDQPMALSATRAFAVDRAGSVYAFDMKTGAELWSAKTDDTTGYLSPPQLVQGMVVTTSLDSPVRALDQGTGEVRWSRKDLATELAPVIFDGRIAMSRGDSVLVLLDPKDGSELSRLQLPGSVHAEMASDERRLLIPLEDGRICAVDVKELEVLWTTTVRTFGSTLVMSSAGELALNDDGTLTLLELATGAPRWSLDLRGTPAGRPSVEQSLAVVTLDDRLAIVALADGKEQNSIQVGAKKWSAAARWMGDYIAAPTRNGELLVFTATASTALFAMPCERNLSVAGDRRSTVVLASGKRLSIYRNLP